MNYSIFGDWETFMHDVGGERIFQMLVYKRMYTPYEQEHKFMDESIYEDSSYTDIIIRETIYIDSDTILGVQCLFDEEDLDIENPKIEYHSIKDILLSYNPEREKYFFPNLEDEDGD